MNFETAARFGVILSKDYAEDFIKLLVNYQDISASEAASRLGLHIRTAQDFLENLTDLEIVSKAEVYEKKRPYFRYTLDQQTISIELDLSTYKKEHPGEGLARSIREKTGAEANFSLTRGGGAFSAVTIWEGEGRERTEKRISLTTPQGLFLFHLPFPQARAATIKQIMEKAEVDEEFSSEIQNIVDELIRLDVVEVLS